MNLGKPRGSTSHAFLSHLRRDLPDSPDNVFRRVGFQPVDSRQGPVSLGSPCNGHGRGDCQGSGSIQEHVRHRTKRPGPYSAVCHVFTSQHLGPGTRMAPLVGGAMILQRGFDI
jgi:hypothetical protein